MAYSWKYILDSSGEAADGRFGKSYYIHDSKHINDDDSLQVMAYPTTNECNGRDDLNIGGHTIRAYYVICVWGDTEYAFAFITRGYPLGSEAQNRYQRNENGQTYGTFLQAGGLSGELPDLIAVEASNGKMGYITREDYYRSSRPAGSREEAVAIMESQQENAAAAFCEYVWVNTGIRVDQSRVSALLGNSGSWWNGWSALTEQQQAAFVSVLPEGFRSSGLAQSAYSYAMGANNVNIPVYAVDGVTVIGELIVK